MREDVEVCTKMIYNPVIPNYPASYLSLGSLSDISEQVWSSDAAVKR